MKKLFLKKGRFVNVEKQYVELLKNNRIEMSKYCISDIF